jgi:hypothetical protein
MGWLARRHVLLWLILLGIVPALVLDLAGVGPEAASGWRVLGAVALTFGFPYYTVELLVGLLSGVRGSPPATVHLVAATVSAFGLLLGDRAISRWVSGRRAEVRDQAI